MVDSNNTHSATITYETLTDDSLAGSSLTSWLQTWLAEKNPQMANSDKPLTKETRWFLWIEPVAKATSKHCSPVFTCWQDLHQVLDDGWQIREFQFFSANQSIQGISLENGSRVVFAHHDMSNQQLCDYAKTAQVIRPYLRQDIARRFGQTESLQSLQTLSQTEKRLAFVAVNNNEKNQASYFLLPQQESA